MPWNVLFVLRIVWEGREWNAAWNFARIVQTFVTFVAPYVPGIPGLQMISWMFVSMFVKRVQGNAKGSVQSNAKGPLRLAGLVQRSAGGWLLDIHF